MATYVLSYPGPRYVPPATSGGDPAGASAASVASSAGSSAAKAFQQWIGLCDQITRAGGRILVIDPVASSSPSPSSSPSSLPGSDNASLLFASQLGAPFLKPASGEGPVFIRARGESSPTGEPDAVRETLKEAGVPVRDASHPWLGQADVVAFPKSRFLLFHGPGTSRESCEALVPLLPLGSQALIVERAASCPRGQHAVAYLGSPGGASVMLVDRGSLKSHTPEDLQKFVGLKVESFVLSPEDTAAGAAEMLPVRGTLLVPTGVSTILRGNLARRGFVLVETELSALVGAALVGAGPRLFTNEWAGFVLSEEAPAYHLRRDELLGRLAGYGEGGAAGPAAPAGSQTSA